MKIWLKSLLTPLLLGCAILGLSTTPAKAIAFVGGVPAGSMGLDQGIVLDPLNRAFVFVTPRHFITSHGGAPATVGGQNVVATQVLSKTAGVNVGDYGFRISEVQNPIAGLTPLPIIFSPDLNDYLGLNLRVFGANGNDYGTQQIQNTLVTTINNDFNPPPTTLNVPTFGFITQPGNPLSDPPVPPLPLVDDLWLYVDVRPGVDPDPAGKAFLASGDSSGALIGVLPGGQLGVLGTANAVVDRENPIGGNMNRDFNVYNFAPHYINEIAAFINARNTVNQTDYQLGILLFDQVIPEPSRALMLSLGLTLILFRRRR